MVKFSFFLPAFKATYLKEAIQSIIRQSYDNWELLIVNDGSSENIASIVNYFMPNSKITYFKNENNLGETDLVGFWNNCLPRCTGEYLIFASDDDIYEPEYLHEMLCMSDNYPDCNLLHCRTRFIDKQGHVIQLTQPALYHESQIDFIYQTLIWGRKLTLQECCFKKKTLEDAGGVVNFPIAWYSDWATAFVMAHNGVAYSEKVLFNLRMSESNLSGQDKKCRQKTDAMKQFVNWLKGFLPTLVCESKDDMFMKERMLSLYKSIIYSHYHNYLPHLGLKAFFQEMNNIRTHHIFNFKTRVSMIIRHLVSL